MVQNKTFVFKKVPNGLPVPGQDLVTEDRPLDLDAQLNPDQILIEELYASFDPYLRGLMRDPVIKSYRPALQPGSPVPNAVIGRVLKSASAAFKEGDTIIAGAPIAEYAVVSAAKDSTSNVRKLENPHGLDLATFLGALGMPGLTAYSSFYKIGQPKKGETILVSSAAGAVGQMVGQLAKREGLRVIGSVGSDDKLDFIINELGFDAGFNYKKESPFDAIPRLAPNGLDIYYENVGGEHLEAALMNMNVMGRIPCCGMISQYNKPPAEQYGPKNLGQIVTKQLLVQGFLVTNPKFGPAYAAEHQKNVSAWIAEGSLRHKLSVTEGIDKAAEGFVGMLQGANFGKAVLKIKKD